jgi:hypothetical protein
MTWVGRAIRRLEDPALIAGKVVLPRTRLPPIGFASCAVLLRRENYGT